MVQIPRVSTAVFRLIFNLIPVSTPHTATCLCTVGLHVPSHAAKQQTSLRDGTQERLVCFNLYAFTSYDHDQGNNAPVSEVAAFAYTNVLNQFLEKGSGHCIQIGDAPDAVYALAAETTFATLL